MNFRPLIVIATYNNAQTIVAVVASIIAVTDHPVLIVDDGSEQPVQGLLREAGLVQGATVQRHAQNLGKGMALRTAFAWAIAHGFTHVLTFDGDGQHLSSEINKLIAAAERQPWAVVVGARRFPSTNVPKSSRVGRAVSNFWIRYETGVDVDDSQSGMRVYPLFFTQCLKLRTRRYDFEVEVLTRLLWAGAQFVEIPIDVNYPPVEERVSHFRKFGDNVRIGALNAVLVTESLFRRHLTWHKAAFAALLMPVIVGLKLPIAIALAGAVAVTLAVQINAYLSLVWFGAGLAYSNYFAPSVPGLFAVAGATALSHLTLGKVLQRGHHHTAWSGKMRGGRFGNGFLRLLSRTLGLGATYACLAAIIPYFFLFAPKARRATREFYQAMSPAQSPLRYGVATFRNFFAFGTVLLDRLFQSFHKHAVFSIEVWGRPNFERAIKGGRGVILLTAHAGGWDLSARVLAGSGLNRDTVLAEFIAAGSTSSEATLRADERGVVTRASLHNEATPLLAYRERLMRGEVIGMMGDRPLTEKLALVPFMGRLAAFDLTPFRLAMSAGVDIVYCFAFKTAFRSYVLTVEAAPDLLNGLANLSAGDKDARAEAAARHFAQALERHVRAHPDQWFNYFPFFSTPPVSAHALR